MLLGVDAPVVAPVAPMLVNDEPPTLPNRLLPHSSNLLLDGLEWLLRNADHDKRVNGRKCRLLEDYWARVPGRVRSGMRQRFDASSVVSRR
jgi:hypothetical protein